MTAANREPDAADDARLDDAAPGGPGGGDLGTLLVTVGPDSGRRFVLPDADAPDTRTAGLGRGTGNRVRLRDTEVSRKHAVIRCGEGRYSLADVGSANGTLVNGERADAVRPLADGDRVQVGRTTLLFARPNPNDSSAAVDLVGGPAHAAPALASFSAAHPPPRDREADAGAARTAASLQVLYRVTEEAVRPSLSTEQLLGRLLDLALNSVGADRGCVLLTDGQDGALRPAARRDRDRPAGEAVGAGPTGGGGSVPGGPMPVSRSIADLVLRTGRAVRTGDAAADDRFDPTQSILSAGVKEALCVPLRGRDDVEGVMYLDTTADAGSSVLAPLPERFTDEHLRMLVAVGRQAALAVEAVRYQRALVRAERLAAVGQTISALSHHIKNILQGLGGGGHLVKTGLDRHDEALTRQGWEIVERNQHRILHLVTDMLTFGKDRRPELELGDVAATVADAVGLARARAAEVGVEVELDAAALPPAWFDAEAIHRAVLNVALNAVDAAAEGRDARGGSGGVVNIATAHWPEADYVGVRVSDDGPGVPPRRAEAIFEPFESGKGSKGTGLGLAVSRKILREHGGDITVESRGAGPGGRGATFHLAWPRRDDDRAGGEPTRGDMPTVQG